MEQQRLFVNDQVLIEGEAGRPDIGDERREPVDAVGDLVDTYVHVSAPFPLVVQLGVAAGAAAVSSECLIRDRRHGTFHGPVHRADPFRDFSCVLRARSHRNNVPGAGGT